MKLITILFPLILFGITSLVQVQPCTCFSNEHSQFDFWIGKWAVYDALDHFVQTNEGT